MLAGKKPLAAFLYSVGEDERIYLDDQPFQTHVYSGRIVRLDHLYERQGVQLHLVLFCLPGEEWRCNAYILMWRLSEKTGWNDTLERMEGTLLGYEDWETDWHMANRDHYQDHGN